MFIIDSSENAVIMPAETLGEAVSRIRQKTIQLDAGFDGQYGKISIFQPGELTTPSL